MSLDIQEVYRTTAVTAILFTENESTASSPLINGDVVQLGNSFMQSEEHRVLIARIQPMLDTLMEKQQSAGYAIRQQNVFYATNFFWQVGFLLNSSQYKLTVLFLFPLS